MKLNGNVGNLYGRKERKEKEQLTIRQHNRKLKPDPLDPPRAKRRLHITHTHRIDNLLTSRRHRSRRRRRIGASRKGRLIGSKFDLESFFQPCEIE